MKKIILIAIIVCSSFSAFSQAELSVYSATGRAGVATTFATDYQAIGINPANLGYGRTNEGKKFTLGLFEVAANVYHEGMGTKDFASYLIDAEDADLKLEDRIKAAQTFETNTVSMNLDFTVFGLAYQDEKFGGLAVTVRESFRYFSILNPTASDYTFRGATSMVFDSLILSDGSVVPNDPNNYSTYQSGGVTIDSGKTSNPFSMGRIVGNSKLKQHWYRDYCVSYGRKVYDNNGIQLYAGLGAKYVAGYNYIDITSDGQKVEGMVALNPITEPIEITGTTSPSNTSNTNYQSIGKGYGFDLGVTLSLKQKIKFGVSAVNIGSVTYNKNVYSIQDTLINKVAFSEKSGFKGVGEIIRWQGETKHVVALPAMLRMGTSISMLDYKLEVGLDAIVPLNNAAGNFDKVWFGVGGDYKVGKILRLSTGFNMGGNTAKKFNLPIGITFSFNNTVEFGVASRDVLSYFQKTGNSYSAAVGVLRIRI